MLTENMACLSEPTEALKNERTTHHLNTIDVLDAIQVFDTKCAGTR